MAAGQLTSVGLDALPGRDLEPEELRELVVALAAVWLSPLGSPLR